MEKFLIGFIAASILWVLLFVIFIKPTLNAAQEIVLSEIQKKEKEIKKYEDEIKKYKKDHPKEFVTEKVTI